MANKGYNRYLVVLGGAMTNFFLGALYTWSVFQKPIENMFGWTTPEVSLAFTINLFMIPILMIVSGKLVGKIGPTKMAIVGAGVLSLGLFIASKTSSLAMLYIGYGLLGGSGIGLAYSVPIATCIPWFPDKRGMVSSLAVAGFGLGSVCYAPVATKLVLSYGPLTTFYYQAIVTFIGVFIAAQLMRPAPAGYIPEGWTPPAAKAGQAGPSKYDFTPREMLRTPQYYFVVVMYTFANVAGLMIIGHASPIGQKVAGLTPVAAGSIVAVLGLVNTLGRLFWGTFSDKIGRLRAVFIMYVISAFAMFTMNYMGTYLLYALGVSMVAFCFGGAMGTFPAITADMYGPKYVGMNYGFIFLAYSAGAIIGPRLAAVVKQASGGEYHMAFIITGVLCSIGAIMALLAKPPKAPADV